VINKTNLPNRRASPFLHVRRPNPYPNPSRNLTLTERYNANPNPNPGAKMD